MSPGSQHDETIQKCGGILRFLTSVAIWPISSIRAITNVNRMIFPAIYLQVKQLLGGRRDAQTLPLDGLSMRGGACRTRRNAHLVAREDAHMHGQLGNDDTFRSRPVRTSRHSRARASADGPSLSRTILRMSSALSFLR
jgi:hypothetical protein